MKYFIFTTSVTAMCILGSIFMLGMLIVNLGCSSPIPPPAPVDTDTVTATDNSTVYLQMIGQLESSLLNCESKIKQLNNQALELQYKLISLQTKDALRQAEYENRIAVIQEEYKRQTSTYTVDTETIELMNEELQKAESRLAIVQSSIDALMFGRVPEISDNLTAAEYDIFRQGWEVWWWTFNEKEEIEESGDIDEK